MFAGCAPSNPKGDSTTTGTEPQDGSPANTPLDQLPIPEKGKTYNNPKTRDEVKDGGTLTQPITEIGAEAIPEDFTNHAADISSRISYVDQGVFPEKRTIDELEHADDW